MQIFPAPQGLQWFATQVFTWKPKKPAGIGTSVPMQSLGWTHWSA